MNLLTYKALNYSIKKEEVVTSLGKYSKKFLWACAEITAVEGIEYNSLLYPKRNTLNQYLLSFANCVVPDLTDGDFSL